jgi:hypothetical protein
VTHYKSMIETEWLGQWDLPGDRDIVVTIDSVDRYNPERRKKKRDPVTGQMVDERNKRIAIGFRNKRKKWLAGPVTQAVIAKMYGNNVEGWIGKQIALYVDAEVTMGREKTGGIRVRPAAPRGKKDEADPLDVDPPQEKIDQLERARGDVAGSGREPGDD